MEFNTLVIIQLDLCAYSHLVHIVLSYINQIYFKFIAEIFNTGGCFALLFNLLLPFKITKKKLIFYFFFHLFQITYLR